MSSNSSGILPAETTRLSLDITELGLFSFNLVLFIISIYDMAFLSELNFWIPSVKVSTEYLFSLGKK